jgi:hypothetical protein
MWSIQRAGLLSAGIGGMMKKKEIFQSVPVLLQQNKKQKEMGHQAT